MILSMKDQIGSILFARDGQVGRISDLLFDARQWVVQFFVALPYPARPECRAFFSVSEIKKVRGLEVHTTISLDEIEARTDIAVPADDNEVPSGYAWPFFMEGRVLSMSVGTEFLSPAATRVKEAPVTNAEFQTYKGLKSISEMVGSEVRCNDGTVGTITDFLFEDKLWLVRFAVVALTLPEQKNIIVFPNWITQPVQKETGIILGFPENRLQHQPEFNPERHLNKEYEKIISDIINEKSYGGR